MFRGHTNLITGYLMSTAAEHALDPPAQKPGRILVVDDDAALLVLFRSTLERAGYKVFEAGNYRECYRVLEQEGPVDAVLLDIMLPEVNGIDILAEIIKRPDPPAAVMITGSRSVEHAVTALKLGAYDYLTKPGDTNNTEKFVNVMSHAVNASRAQRRINALESALMEQQSPETVSYTHLRAHET